MGNLLVLDYKGIRENILNSDFMKSECERIAKDEGAKAYPEGFHTLSFKGTQRAHAFAFPNTKNHGGNEE